MTLQECYDRIGSDYNKALSRMYGKEAMLAKFVKKFPNDPTYPSLISSYESGDMETAFRMAHTLKGLCMNLGIDKLLSSASILTEALRDTENISSDADDLLKLVKSDYEETVNAINEID